MWIGILRIIRFITRLFEQILTEIEIYTLNSPIQEKYMQNRPMYFNIWGWIANGVRNNYSWNIRKFDAILTRIGILHGIWRELKICVLYS